MKNFNFQLARVEANLNQILEDIPTGMAYFILKSKINELEKEYYKQVQKEYAEVVQQQQKDQKEKTETQTTE